MGRSIGGHHSARMGKDEWLTPIEIIQPLGAFDLDPCAPVERPWETATLHYTVEDNGLTLPWSGRVWMNPPYGQQAVHWLSRLADHEDGIALIFARTETEMFFNQVWSKATSLLFLKGRLFFHHVDGTRAKHNSGAPSVLIAYNDFNADSIEDSGIAGHHIYLKGGVFIVGLTKDHKSWRLIVGDALEELSGEATVEDIYNVVCRLAPQRVKANKHSREKVRQMLQKHYNKIRYATYTN